MTCSWDYTTDIDVAEAGKCKRGATHSYWVPVLKYYVGGFQGAELLVQQLVGHGANFVLGSLL